MLGGISLWVGDEQVPLRGPQRRLLVGMLIADVGNPVAAERLAEGIRGGAPPRAQDPVNAVHAHVARLRRLLDAASDGEGSRWVASSVGGYVLRPDELDLWEYDRLVHQCTVSSPMQKLGALSAATSALDLWATPWGDLADSSALVEAARSLELRHRGLEETWAALTVDLAVGREHCDRLVRLARAEPTRERRWSLAMRGLVQADRQGEALALYGEARRFLALDLGVEPGPHLASTHRAVLHQDPTLVLPTKSSDPDNLPAVVADFVGRDSELDALDGLVTRARVVTVSGLGGVGKSRLLAEWVRRRGRQPMTQWVDLRGTVAGGVPTRVADELGLSPERNDAQHLLGLIETVLCRSPTVLVLDDADDSDGAVADLALLLAARVEHLTVVVTARHPLGITGEGLLALAPLPIPAPGRPLQGSAVHLASLLLGIDVEDGLARQVAEKGGGLPTAVALVASQHRGGIHRGTGLNMSPGAGSVVAGAVEDAVAQLSPRALTLLTRSSHLPGGMSLSLSDVMSPDTMTSFAALDLRGDRGDRAKLLRELVAESLMLTETDRHGLRYRVLQPVADALSARSGADDAGEAMRRLTGWANANVRQSYFLTPDRAGLALVAAEHVNIDAALQRGQTQDPAGMLELAVSMAEVWAFAGRVADGHRWIDTGLASASEAGTVPGPSRARALIALTNSRGLAHIAAHGDLVVEAVELLADEGLTTSDMWAVANSQLTVVLGWRGDVEGMTKARTAVRVAVSAAQSEWFEGLLLELDGLATLVHGRPLTGVPDCLRAVKTFEDLGDLEAAAVAAYFACVLARMGGMSTEPMERLLRRSEELAASAGTIKSRALVAGELARFAVARGNPERAEELARALTLTERAGNLHHAAMGRRDLGLMLLRDGQRGEAAYQLLAATRHLLRTDPPSSALAVAGLARLRSGGEHRVLAGVAWSLARGAAGTPVTEFDLAHLLVLVGPQPETLPSHEAARRTLADLLGVGHEDQQDVYRQ